MKHSQFGLMTYRLFIGFCVTLLLIIFSACKSFDKTDAEIAIKKYVQRTFYRPDTYEAVHYYAPMKTTVSTDPADRNNSSFSKDKNKIVEGWGIGVDIKAMNRNNEESGQSAAFYLNAECDSVIFSDIAPQFMKVDSPSIFGAAH